MKQMGSPSSPPNFAAVRWPRFKFVLKVLSTVALVLYPFAVWAGVSYGKVQWLVWLLVLFFVIRLLVLGGVFHTSALRGRAVGGGLVGLGAGLALLGLALCGASIVLKNHNLLLYYPVCVSFFLLCFFGVSLFSKMPVVERIARLKDPHLLPQAVAYTRQVTKAWCFFFVFNGVLAFATCLYANMKLWALYNGLISYLLIGMLMGGEWLMRKNLQRKIEQDKSQQAKKPL